MDGIKNIRGVYGPGRADGLQMANGSMVEAEPMRTHSWNRARRGRRLAGADRRNGSSHEVLIRAGLWYHRWFLWRAALKGPGFEALAALLWRRARASRLVRVGGAGEGGRGGVLHVLMTRQVSAQTAASEL